MFKAIKIKQKLLLISALSQLIVMLFAVAVWIDGSIVSSQKNLNNRIESQGSIVSRNITAAILFEDMEEAKVILSALSSDYSIFSASLMLSQESSPVTLFFKKNNDYRENVIFDFLKFIYPVNEFEKKINVIKNNEIIAIINIFYDDIEVQNLLFDLVFSGFLVIFGAIALGSLLSGVIYPLVTKPINRLSNVAQEVITSKNYSLRAEFFYPDEVGRLTKDFNAMLSIIEQRDYDLEGLIKVRTQQLENKNKELKEQMVEREELEGLRKESEEKFERAFINAPIGMALLDRSGMFFRSNYSMEDLLNKYTVNGNISATYITKIIDPRKLDDLRGNILNLIEGKKNQFEIEAKCFCLSSEPLYAILSFSAVYNSKGEFLYAVLQLQDITSARKMEADLHYQAFHDSLTGIANRRYLNKKLDDVISSSRDNIITLCVLDLDRFKVVNDTCGHLAGDELLKNISTILKENIRSQDFLARLGGDEFAVLLVDCPREKALHVTEKLRKKIEDYDFFWQESIFKIGCSIGCFCIFPNENPGVLSLLQKADSACYAAKDLGRNRVYFAEAEDRTLSRKQGESQWVNRINDALANSLFILYIQEIKPLKDVAPKKRYEVLIRMIDREDGSIISPGAFIPTSERYGLASVIDRWVINELITILSKRPQMIEDNTYWVNLSGLSIGDEKFIADIEGRLKDAALPAGTINFEITETAVMRNITDSSAAISRLSSTGCQFALDDFGSGASSFGYLRNLPVDYIKIDGMFIKDIVSNEIDGIFVKSIIDIAQVMNIKVVAEFVESEEIRQKLLVMGADYAQGFAIDYPHPLI